MFIVACDQEIDQKTRLGEEASVSLVKVVDFLGRRQRDLHETGST